MSIQKTIAMFAVLCLIALGLGYWVGQLREGSREENVETTEGNKEGIKKEAVPKEPEFLKQGLVAYYPFNGNAKDESGNNDHGFLEGPTSTTNRFGQLNQAIAFDGAKDGVSLPNQVYNGLESFTFTTWLILDALKKSPSILSLANKNDDNAFYILFVRGGFNVAFSSENRESLSISTDDFVHHWRQIIVARESSEASIKVYIDGELKSNLAYTKTGPLIVDPGGAWLGQEQDSLGGEFDNQQALKGQLDDIRIYNRALSEAEVKALYDFEKAK